jgi:hypothetical protein
VPHTSLKLQAKAGSSSGLDSLLPPPKLSFNGTPSSIPVSPYKTSFSELEDAKTRRREPDDYEPSYPEVITSSLLDPTSSSSPIIPLSPDPFGRFPSFPSTPSPSSTQPSPFLDKPLPQPMTRYSTIQVPPEQRASSSHNIRESLASTIEAAASRPPSSRFSLDSTEDGKSNRISASLNPVKSIKSLWKKGRKLSISSGSGSIVAALQIGSSPPSPQPPTPPVPNISSTSSPRSLTPAPSTASRESVTSLVIPSERHAPKALYYDTPTLSTSQLQQSRSSPSMSSMFFNQESPYPVHVLPSNSTRRRRRTASQSARAISSASLTDVDVMPPPPPLPPSSEKEKANVPKSILKSKRTESSTSLFQTEQHAVSSRQSRTDAMLSRTTSSSGRGRVTPPSSPHESSTRVFSPTKSRQWPNPPPLPSQPSPEGFEFKS